MAIGAPSAVGSNTRSGVGPIVVTVSLTAGETGWFFFADEEGSAAAVGTPTGGGTWFQRVADARTSAARFHAELWTTAAGALSTAASISIPYTGTPNQVIVFAGSYPGVTGFGNTGVGKATSTNPIVSLTTTGTDSWSVSGLATWDGTAPAAPALAGTWRKSAQATGASDISGNMIDNTRTTPGTLACSMTEVSTEWIALAIEMKGALPPAAVLGGSITSATTETDIVIGAKVITLAVSGTTWIP